MTVVPPYVPAVVLTVVVAIVSDKLKWRGPFMLIFLPITMIGRSCLALWSYCHIHIFSGYILAIVAKVSSLRSAQRILC